MINKERFLLLLEKYTLDTISPEEHSEFLASLTSGMYDDLVLQHIGKNLQTPDADLEGANLPPHRSAEILHKILSSEKQNYSILPATVSRRTKIMRWTVAAAITSAVLVSAWLLTGNKNKKAISIASLTKNMEERANSSGQPLKIKMEDGSMVTLQPGSVIHYPNHFLPGKREIYLEGEAFFEVTKNASRPFFVYNENIVTHVLGTSFNVKMNPKTKQVEVSVRSGRVEVYENNQPEKSSEIKKNNGVILLPNQKVVYDEAVRQFVPSLVDKPLPVIREQTDTKIETENTAFEETPLKTVLPRLEKDYGVEIVTENENIYKCLFTGDISQQNLYTRLDVVCEAVGATYEVKGTKILIKGKGCN